MKLILILVLIMSLAACGKDKKSSGNSKKSLSGLTAPTDFVNADDLFNYGIIPGEVVNANGVVLPALFCKEMPGIKNSRKWQLLRNANLKLDLNQSESSDPVMYQFGDCKSDSMKASCHILTSRVLKRLIISAMMELDKYSLEVEKCPKDILSKIDTNVTFDMVGDL